MFSTLAHTVSCCFRQGTSIPKLLPVTRLALGLRHYSIPAPGSPPSEQTPRPAGQDPAWTALFTSLPDPEAQMGTRQTPHEIWAMNHGDVVNRAPPANAYTGRTVYVGRDGFGEAYRRLEIILSRNRVRATVRMQERHEKKGVKRRRLSSERWRKQFANEVRKKVQLVKDIRNRGA